MPAVIFQKNIILRLLLIISFIPLAAFAHNFDTEALESNTDINQSETWNLHAQFTHTTQWHPTFDTACNANKYYCMPGRAQRKQTNDATLYFGLRLWQNAELYINTEVNEGFGLSDTHGLAGFSSGESYKLGKPYPYTRTQRFFIRQVFELGGENKQLESSINQIAGSRQSDNFIMTAGKFSLIDIFDGNSYAHDPRSDFLNWAIVDAGAFDYAADAWGYVYGLAGELNKSDWTIRAALTNLSKEPGSVHTDMTFKQWSGVGEIEKRYTYQNHEGKVRVLGFLNHGNMANYKDAINYQTINGLTEPDVSLVRHESSKVGMAINWEQSITSEIGLFGRFSMNDGNKETWDFTDISRSVSFGAALNGGLWDRSLDKVGIAFAINDISKSAKEYFQAGGLGLLIGEGPHKGYSSEQIFEAYYLMHINPWCHLTADYQFIQNPAYNPNTDDISIVGLRMHLSI